MINTDIKTGTVWVIIEGIYIGFDKERFTIIIKETTEYKEAVTIKNELIGRP